MRENWEDPRSLNSAFFYLPDYRNEESRENETILMENGEGSEEYVLLEDIEELEERTGRKAAFFQEPFNGRVKHDLLYQGFLREEDGDLYLERQDSPDQDVPEDLSESAILVGVPAESEQRYD